MTWKDISRPKEKGGLGFKCLFDVSKMVFYTLWRMYRTQKSIWTNFMWNKYRKKGETSNGRMERWFPDLKKYVGGEIILTKRFGRSKRRVILVYGLVIRLK